MHIGIHICSVFRSNHSFKRFLHCGNLCSCAVGDSGFQVCFGYSQCLYCFIGYSQLHGCLYISFAECVGVCALNIFYGNCISILLACGWCNCILFWYFCIRLCRDSGIDSHQCKHTHNHNTGFCSGCFVIWSETAVFITANQSQLFCQVQIAFIVGFDSCII